MIILLVDNKERDLPAMVKLGEKILSKYNTRVVISNYHEVDDIFEIERKNITSVLFSYCKKDSKTRLVYASKSKYKVVVYDQEGANGFDCLGIANIWKKNKQLISYVDSYNFWGEKQKKACLKISKNKKPKRNNVIGYIRNEINLHDNSEFFFKKYVIVCTNFAFVNPRYNTNEKEIETVKRANLYGKNTMKFYKEMQTRRIKFLHDTEKLIKNNKDINFLIRPHPYEDQEEWINLTQKYKNIKITTNKNALHQIRNAKCLLHIDSITSLEAAYNNVPAISCGYLINKSKLCFQVLSKTGLVANSYDDLNKKIKNYYFSKKTKNIKINKNIKSYFGKLDGKRTDKLADELILNSKMKLNQKENFDFPERPIRTKIKIFLRRHLKLNFFIIIYYLVVGVKKARKYKSKQFNLELMKKYLGKKFVAEKYYSNSYEIKKLT